MANEGTPPNYNYDVYISFKREDSERLASSLCHALSHKGFIVYETRDELPPEEAIPSSLSRVIEESRISIVIFSKNYLTPKSLHELKIISACHKVKTQLVYPIFYNVNPDDVRNRSEMADLEHRLGTEMVENVLEVAYLREWVFRLDDENLNGYEFIQHIVKEITKGYRINRSFSSYDVFLSFNETDTRYSFTDFLYNVLQREGFKTYRDDLIWELENPISPSRKEAIIEESKVSIIVFSKNYANSSRRLDTLVKILNCNQRVLPIFYKLQPSDVRYQEISDYSNAMDRLESGLENGSEEVEKWRRTLFDMANFSGWHFETGYEYKTMQKVVAMVKKSFPRYDVFLSFRGKDTRHTFTGYLYYALCKKGFKTFMDDIDLEGGDKIAQTLTNAIKESRFSIIVFSENYAFSSWCLDELVNILDWKCPQVWPIYYKVEPSDVWQQENSYERAMTKHENTVRRDPATVQKWRSALSQVSSLEKKWHFKDGGYEFEFIENLVEKISNVYSRVYG